MRETHNPHFFHDAALVRLGDTEFFVDSALHALSDAHLGQMLCGFAFDCGALQMPPARSKDYELSAYELSGWNEGGGI